MSNKVGSLAAALAAVMLLSAVGCGKKQEDENGSSMPEMSFEALTTTQAYVPELHIAAPDEVESEEEDEAWFLFTPEETDPEMQAAINSMKETGVKSSVNFGTETPLDFVDSELGETFGVMLHGTVIIYETAEGEADVEQLKSDILSCLENAVGSASGNMGFERLEISANELEQVTEAQLINSGWYVDSIAILGISLDEGSKVKYDELTK